MMKTRILGLLLALVMTVTALVSCAYSFESDDMTKYATSFDEAAQKAFRDALNALAVEDADFTATESTRQEKVIVQINQKLADAVEKIAANRKKDGAYQTNQQIYYCYYGTFEKDGKQIYFAVDKMKASSPLNFIGANASEDEMTKAIFAALENGTIRGSDMYLTTSVAPSENAEAGQSVYVTYKYSTVPLKNGQPDTSATPEEGSVTDAKKTVLPAAADTTFEGQLIGKAFSTTLSDKIVVTTSTHQTTYSGIKMTPYSSLAEGGKTVFVSYTRAYKPTDSQTTKTETVTLQPIQLPATDDGTFAGKLIGKALATSLDEMKITGEAGVSGETTYTSVKVEWQVEQGKEYNITHVLYPVDAEGSTKVTDIYGTSHDIEGKEVALHVYPMYVYEIEGMIIDGATDNDKLYEKILTTLLGESITAKDLSCFSDEYSYTEGEKTLVLAAIVKAVTDKKEAYDTAKSAYDTAEKEYDAAKTEYDTIVKNENASEDAVKAKKEAMDEKKTAMDKKQTDMNDADTALDKAVENLPAEIAKCGGDVKDRVVADYKQKIYDELNATYKSAMAENVKKAVYKLMVSSVGTVDKTPEAAVKEAVDRIYAEYKYNYYTGTVSTTNQTSLKDEYASVKEYIKESYKTATYEEAEAKMYEEAVAQVKDIVMVYAIASLYPDIKVGTDDVNYFVYIKYLTQQGNASQEQLLEAYGEINIRCYLLFDKLMDHFVEVDDKKPTIKDETKGEEKINYKNIQYVIKAEA